MFIFIMFWCEPHTCYYSICVKTDIRCKLNVYCTKTLGNAAFIYSKELTHNTIWVIQGNRKRLTKHRKLSLPFRNTLCCKWRLAVASLYFTCDRWNMRRILISYCWIASQHSVEDCHSQKPTVTITYLSAFIINGLNCDSVLNNCCIPACHDKAFLLNVW